jgi:hypothetical protein
MSMSCRFKEASGVVASLEVRDPTGSTSLEELYRVLLAMRVQLVTATELSIDGLTVFELDVCELDGGKLKDARRRSILTDLSETMAERTDRVSHAA